jgi:hypothetical protein
MPFTVPNFNLPVSIFDRPASLLTAPPTVPRASTVCNLTPGRRVQPAFPDVSDSSVQIYLGTAFLLLPAGTDIRDLVCVGDSCDILEVPSLSGRWYTVLTVDDVAKGFPNEYRTAMIAKLGPPRFFHPGYFWPVPMP